MSDTIYPHDPAEPFPVDWRAWRALWADWRPAFESRHGVSRWNTRRDGRCPFEGRNLLADEVLGVWAIGTPGRRRAVELSEVTFTIGETCRYIGVTIDESGPGGTTGLASTFAELDEILAPLATGPAVP